jgi:hypothetical protein
MNERAEPLENGELIEALIESQNIEAEHEFCDPQGKSSPTFYTMLLFHRAFCEFAFDDSFDFLLRNDPYYGVNTFGQVARLMPERAYVMYHRLQQLKNGGWKTVSWEEKEYSTNAVGDIVEITTRGLFFGKFIESLRKVPTNSEHAATQQFFEKMVTKFLSIFESNLNKHISQRWRNDKLIVYLLAGDPELAKQMARTLAHWDGDAGAVHIDAEGQPINNDEQFTDYPNKVIELGPHHTISGRCGPVRINVRDAMIWLTELADFRNILLTDRFVKKYKDLILELALSETTVRLFDRKDGELFSFLPRWLPLFSDSFLIQAKWTQQHGMVPTTNLSWMGSGGTLAFIRTINSGARTTFSWLL